MIKNTLLIALLLVLAVRAVDLGDVHVIGTSNITLTADTG